MHNKSQEISSKKQKPANLARTTMTQSTSLRSQRRWLEANCFLLCTLHSENKVNHDGLGNYKNDQGVSFFLTNF